MTDSSSHFLDAHAACRQYLALPRHYVDGLGGLRWSENLDGMVLATGEVVVANEQLAQFLEGFASKRSLMAFGSMLHWATLFAGASEDVDRARLRSAFQICRENWRNAGALAGMMGEPLVASAEAPHVKTLCERLREPAFPIRWFTGALNSVMNRAEEPAHSILELAKHVHESLSVLSDQDLTSWLKYGRGPVRRAGETLAREQPPPRFAGSILDELFKRPRLAGAQAYFQQMVLALSVPPRRQSPEQLPMGGYVDVVTHGSVDRLLPSQHALDELEFLRRYSENELLYFRREEPPAQHRQEVVVVLDQGVRTWGDVRLVLTAAAIALTQHADRRKLDCRLVCTSRPGSFVNPFTQEDTAVGPALEASDFTRNPGWTLEGVLEWPSAVPRDVFLLTHPFSVKEEDVQAAARRLGERDRLFALTVNGKGDAELMQIRRGLPVRLRSFRVEFTPAKTVAAEPPATTEGTWTGAVEPIGWPFRFGSDSPVELFDFDYSGRRLFAVMADGMIHAWDLTNGEHEILPRPRTPAMQNAAILDLVGVTGGFVILKATSGLGVIAHYDWHQRTCAVHSVLQPDLKAVRLNYVRHLNSIVLADNQTRPPVAAIDLATGQLSVGGRRISPRGTTTSITGDVGAAVLDASASVAPRQRAEQASEAYENDGPLTDIVPILQYGDPETLQRTIRAPSCYFDPHDEVLRIWDGISWLMNIGQRADGKSAFAGARIHEVRLAGNTLAVHYQTPPHSDANRFLAFFRGPDGHFLRETHWTTSRAQTHWDFRLSKDGGKVAMLRNQQQLEVQLTDRPQRILYSRTGGFGTHSRLWVGLNSVLLCCGRKGYAWHLLQWSRGKLEVHSDLKPSRNPAYEEFHHPLIKEFLRKQEMEEAVAGGAQFLGDPQRWPRGAQRDGACFVLDRFGQVLIFDAEKKLVFQFFGHGDSWSAWLPDGTRHGLGMVHTWPNTPHALRRMGEALRNATGGARP